MTTPRSAPITWVERTGTRTYQGFNDRGATVALGPVAAGEVFTPGELLKVALAACAGMSSDHTFSKRLGDDYDVRIRVEDVSDPAQDRYPVLTEQIEIDLSELSDTDRDRLLAVALRAIGASCTVGRTLTHGAVVRTQFSPTAQEA